MLPLIGLVAEHAEISLHGATNAYHVANRFYVEAVYRAGGLPVILPHVATAAEMPGLVGRLDGAVLCGGIDIDPACYGAERDPRTNPPEPARDAFESAFIDAALAASLPILGICRGLQSLNVALGGTMVQHLDDHPTDLRWDADAHPVAITPGSRLAQIVGSHEIAVNSLHHQAIDRLGTDVAAVGVAPDGVVEAIELVGHTSVVAVQWHPEVLVERSDQRALFENLVADARRRRS
jgi:putative glutamine amidotransferase